MPEQALVEPSPEHHASAEGRSGSQYEEFRGPGGERYLKKLLRQILPMALYRTWEIFVDHQARGNDCYLSLSQLAALAGRAQRTMQKNLACLQARQLVVERAERKVFHGPDGRDGTRLVLVKDFAALYALAHEYHEWLHDPDTIPAQRAFVPVISQKPALVAKLRRFDNYRRLLYNRVPGREASEREEDRWFRHNDADTVQQPAANAEASDHPLSQPFWSAKERSKEMAKRTPKRIIESSQREDSKQDSFDSASSPSSTPLPGALTGSPPESPARQSQRSRSTEERRSQRQDRSERAQPAGEKEEAPGDQTKHASISSESQHPIRQSRVPNGTERPPDHPLARSFLQEITASFGDRNPPGSLTRVLRIIANASLGETEVAWCLVRAWSVARQTRTLRASHYDPATGQANRMPLFCTLFERFMHARLHAQKWPYSWQQMEEDLATDEHVSVWWSHHQPRLALQPPDPPEPSSPDPADASTGAENVPPEVFEETEALPPIRGWMSQDAAYYWGEQLLEGLLARGYEAEVRIHREESCYQLILVGEDGSWVLQTPQQVQQLLRQLEAHALAPRT